jgi:hypothetical protein
MNARKNVEGIRPFSVLWCTRELGFGASPSIEGTMADDAGFAVALTVRGQLLSNALSGAYADNKFPRTLDTTQFGGLPGGPPDADLNVFLGPPQLATHADNSLTIAP